MCLPEHPLISRTQKKGIRLICKLVSKSRNCYCWFVVGLEQLKFRTEAKLNNEIKRQDSINVYYPAVPRYKLQYPIH
jgi:hypothetical protein